MESNDVMEVELDRLGFKLGFHLGVKVMKGIFQMIVQERNGLQLSFSLSQRIQHPHCNN